MLPLKNRKKYIYVVYKCHPQFSSPKNWVTTVEYQYHEVSPGDVETHASLPDLGWGECNSSSENLHPVLAVLQGFCPVTSDNTYDDETTQSSFVLSSPCVEFWCVCVCLSRLVLLNRQPVRWADNAPGQFKSWLHAEGRAADTSDYIQYFTMAPKMAIFPQQLRIKDVFDLN